MVYHEIWNMKNIKPQRKVQALVALCVALLGVTLTSAGEVQPKPIRPWTPADSVSVRYVLPLSGESKVGLFKAAGSLHHDEYILPSPDGRYLLFLTTGADLYADCSISTIELFAVEAIRGALTGHGFTTSALAPLKRIEFRSTSSFVQPVKISRAPEVEWQDDGEAFYVTGISRNGTAQLFRYVVKTSKLDQLTDHHDSPSEIDYEGISGTVGEFASSECGLVFVGRETMPPKASLPMDYPYAQFELDENGEMERKQFKSTVTYQVYARYAGGPAKVVSNLETEAIKSITQSSFSPNGKLAVCVRKTLGGSEFALIDIETATLRAICAAQAEQSADRSSNLGGTEEAVTLPRIRSLWISMNEVVLVGAKNDNQHDNSIVVWNVTTGKCSFISSLSSSPLRDKAEKFALTSLHWDEHEGNLTAQWCSSKGRMFTTVCSRTSSDWRETLSGEITAPAQQVLEVFVRQSENTPPIVVARLEGREIALMRDDPIFAQAAMNPMIPIEWKDQGGYSIRGLLCLPNPSVDNENNYPLVIQLTHPSGRLDKFNAEGAYVNTYESIGDAARSLAARGIAVLVLPYERNEQVRGLSDEGLGTIRKIDDAVALLRARGIVNPVRIGLTGFSRAGFHVLRKVTHPGRESIAAGIMTDSFTGAYSHYLDMHARTGLRSQIAVNYDKRNGGNGGTFWENKAAWLEMETTFNADRVRTPLLFLDNVTIEDRLMETGYIAGALRANNRPFDLMSFPFATHALFRPKQRLAQIEAIVDWMAFWLKDDEPADMRRAARWRTLRKRQELVLLMPPPASGKWEFRPSGEPTSDSKGIQ